MPFSKDHAYDTRDLFDEFTLKNMSEWYVDDSDGNVVDYTKLTPEQQLALTNLPIVTGSSSPMESNDNYNNDQVEYIVRVNGAYYYVNTEGFKYSRYIFCIINFPTKSMSRLGEVYSEPTG